MQSTRHIEKSALIIPVAFLSLFSLLLSNKKKIDTNIACDFKVLFLSLPGMDESTLLFSELINLRYQKLKLKIFHEKHLIDVIDLNLPDGHIILKY